MHLPRKLRLLGTTGRHAFDLICTFKNQEEMHILQDWEMGGPDKDARFNDIFEVGKRLKRKSDYSACAQVELDPDGVVSYWKKDKEVGVRKRLAVASLQESAWRKGTRHGC